MSKDKDSTTLASAFDDEFKAMRTIMDAVTKNWNKLAPDTRVWVKSRLDKLPTGKLEKIDVESERV